jgi:ribosomal protein L37AE/L43A
MGLDKLKSCPFCGSDIVEKDLYGIRCDGCGCEMPADMKGLGGALRKQTMIKRWNMRSRNERMCQANA